jgi:hypothetical protein
VSSNGSTAHGLCQAPTKRNGGEAQSNDIGLALAEEHGVEVYTSIREALCCNHGPGGELAVDGVILVGEHGDCELLTTTARLHHHLPAHSLTHSLHSALSSDPSLGPGAAAYSAMFAAERSCSSRVPMTILPRAGT